MNMTIDMPVVSACSITDCAYNTDERCHAKAITIGDGDTPHCDTLFCGSPSVKSVRQQAGIGACKVSSCSYNDDLECSANSITVGLADDSVKCLTYSTR